MGSIPERFSCLRESQRSMMELISAQTKRFSAHVAPTGVGKTLGYVSGVVRRGSPCTVVLTHSLALQDQILRDFGENGLVKDLRGAGNFPCCETGGTCADGLELGCRTPASRCGYRSQFLSAAPILSTNYALWLSMSVSGSQWTPQPSVLVLDEAHLALSAVDQHCSPVISPQMLQQTGVWHSDSLSQMLDWDAWKLWAKSNAAVAESKIRSILQRVSSGHVREDELDTARIWSSIRRQITLILDMPKRSDEVVIQDIPEGLIASAVLPHRAAARYLFRSVPTMVLVSATLSRLSLRMLGVPESHLTVTEYDSPFDPARCPVYVLNGPPLSHSSDEGDYRAVFQSVAGIIRSRPGRRGIIHTVSYDRAARLRDYLAEQLSPQEHSRIIYHGPRQAAEAINQFSVAGPDSVLVSPAVGTGYDFPGEMCEFQVVVKAPYPNISDPLVKARSQYSDYMADAMAQSLVQISGRNMRSEDDRGETFIVDGAVRRALDRSPSLFPLWFRKRVIRISSASIPAAPPKAEEN